MNPIIKKHIPSFDTVIEHAKKELATLRTGRANALMVENILVEAYGVKTPLKQISSISVPEARTLVIQPWDQNLAKEIEKAITEARIGIMPVNEGKIVRLTIPQLTTESREELVKHVHQKLEEFRIRLRSARDKVRDEVMKAEKEKDITEDEKFHSFKDIENLVQEYNESIKKLGEAKEKEIMTI